MKSLKIIKEKLLPILVAGGITVSMTGCQGKVDMSSKTFGELLQISEIKDSTQLDEQMYNCATNDNNMSYVTGADVLERYMHYLEAIEGIDFTGVEELRLLDEQEYLSTKTMCDDELKYLVACAKTEGESLVEKENHLIALKKLKYLHDHCDNWIKANGNDVALKIMMHSLKAAVADELNVPFEEYNTIIIPGKYNNDIEAGELYYVRVGDTVYDIADDSSELCNTINYIFAMQNAELTDKAIAFATYKKALNYAKTTLAAGASFQNGSITAERNADYIENNYIKK